MSIFSAHSRRRFLVSFGGSVIGTYLMPWLRPVTVAEAAVPATEPVKRVLIQLPIKKVLQERFMLVWLEDTGDGVHLMKWQPENPEEEAEANRFYQEVRGWHKPIDVSRPLPKRDAAEQPHLRAMLREAYKTDQANYDPKPFLAYAKIRERLGDPIGEFIRVCVEIDGVPDDDPKAEALNRRWREMMDTFIPQHFAPLQEMGISFETAGTFFPMESLSTQGLIDFVEITRPGILPELADRLFAFAPFLHKIVLDYDAIDLEGLAKCRQLGQVDNLEFDMVGLKMPGVRKFLRSPNLGQLTRLEMSDDSLGPELGEAVASSAMLGRLRELNVEGNAMGLEGTAALCRSPKCAGLATLYLGGNDLDEECLNAICTSPYFRSLSQLSLCKSSLMGAIGHFHSAGFVPRLTFLSLENCGLEDGDLADLAKLPLTSIQRLTLHDNSFSLKGIGALTKSEHIREPLILRMGSCRLNDAAIRRLAQWSALQVLLSLQLEFNDFGAAGVRALCESPNLRKIEVLNLAGNKLSAEAVKILAKSKLLENVRELTLFDSRMGPAGAKALAASPYLNNLSELSVSKADVEAGGEALIERFGEGVVSLSNA